MDGGIVNSLNNIDMLKKCKICGREATKLRLGMCRKHYEQYGYKKIKLSKFESYGLYNENSDFIKTENISAEI